MRDPDRTSQRLLSELGSRHEIGGGTSAAGSSDIPVPATARIPQLGVFVPGYTRDILISPDLLFASFLPLVSLSLFLSSLHSILSLSLCFFTFLALYVFLLFFLLAPLFSLILLFNIVPRNPF